MAERPRRSTPGALDGAHMDIERRGLEPSRFGISRSPSPADRVREEDAVQGRFLEGRKVVPHHLGGRGGDGWTRLVRILNHSISRYCLPTALSRAVGFSADGVQRVLRCYSPSDAIYARRASAGKKKRDIVVISNSFASLIQPILPSGNFFPPTSTKST